MADDISDIYDLLKQIQAVEIAGASPFQIQDKGGFEYDPEVPNFSSDLDHSYDCTDRSSATEQDYLLLGGYVNQSLQAYSIPFRYPGPIDFNFKTTISRVRVVNTILDLLNQRQQSKEFIVEAQEVIRKLGVSKRDLKQRTETVIKDCNIQQVKIKELSSELLKKDADFRRKEEDLNENLEELLRDKKSLEFGGKWNMTENKKKNIIIQELKKRAKSLMNYSEKRVTLGLRAVNADLIFGTYKPSNDDRSKRDENELMKEELQYKKEQIEYLTNENQSIRHDLMTLRHEVSAALKICGEEVNDDDLFESMSFGELNVEPLSGGMSWNESSLDKPGDAYKFTEETEIPINSNAPAGEDYEGPLPSQLVNIPTIPQPGSRSTANVLHETSELENVGHFDNNFEKTMANGSNFADGFLSNIISGLDTKNFLEYENVTYDQK